MTKVFVVRYDLKWLYGRQEYFGIGMRSVSLVGYWYSHLKESGGNGVLTDGSVQGRQLPMVGSYISIRYWFGIMVDILRFPHNLDITDSSSIHRKCSILGYILWRDVWDKRRTWYFRLHRLCRMVLRWNIFLQIQKGSISWYWV